MGAGSGAALMGGGGRWGAQGERCIGLFAEVAEAVGARAAAPGNTSLPVVVEFRVAAGLDAARGLAPREIIRAMGNVSFLPSLSLALRAATGSATQRAGLWAVPPHLLANHTSASPRRAPGGAAPRWAAACAALLLAARAPRLA
jgi:hypothetical protein